MPFDCNLDNSSSKNTCNAANARMANFQFEKGKTYLLRLINAGASGSQKFSIDNHELTVVTNDFTLIEPYKTQVVTLGVGQRSDVLVKATGSATDSFWMRSDIDVACLNITSYQPNATAIIHYSKADPARLPTTSRTAAWVSNNCANVSDETLNRFAKMLILSGGVDRTRSLKPYLFSGKLLGSRI